MENNMIDADSSYVEIVSHCCGASLYPVEVNFCSQCGEHCDPVEL
tara:strand:- start:66 stop:200 length:135 start_codon:yes stop_codon:yes gene_type:complete